MRVYVAGAMSDIDGVRAVQQRVRAAGHELTLDWTRAEPELQDYAADPVGSGRVAAADLAAALSAEAVVVVVPPGEGGRGMFVELGSALTRAERGELDHVVVVGDPADGSVFYFHPRVQRVADIDEWLAEPTP